MTRLALALAAALTLSAPCTPAYAKTAPPHAAPKAAPPPLCAPLTAHAAYLARRWGERPFAPGRIGRAATVILFVNPATRTWTLIRVLAAGVGCAIGAGRPPGRTTPPPQAAPVPDRSVF